MRVWMSAAAARTATAVLAAVAMLVATMPAAADGGGGPGPAGVVLVSPLPPGAAGGSTGAAPLLAAPRPDTTTVDPTGTAAAREVIQPRRIAGTDRYRTAAAIAAEFGRADTIIVANGENARGGFDALAANYLAGRLGAPILLTPSDTLPGVVAAAVRSTLAGSAQPRIIVMGGADAISSSVAGALDALAREVTGVAGPTVTRIGGGNRYDTAVMAAAAGADRPGARVSLQRGSAPQRTAILTSGTSNADALAAGPLSNAWGLPVLLSSSQGLPASVADAIHDWGIEQLLVLGGPERIPRAVLDQAGAAGVVSVRRIAGANRAATAAELYRAAVAEFADESGRPYAAGSAGVRAFVANGVSGFPDALAIGPLAARQQDVLLTVTGSRLDPAARQFLTDHGGLFGGMVALGAVATVPDTALADAGAAISGRAPGADAGPEVDAEPGATAQPREGPLTAGAALGSRDRFLAAATGIRHAPTLISLARSFLPRGGTEIAQLHPFIPSGFAPNVAGLTEFPSCQVWLNPSLSAADLYDVLLHEYVHALQCRRYGLSAGSVYPDVERIADAGAFLLGAEYLYYVQYGPKRGSLRPAELDAAAELLAAFR